MTHVDGMTARQRLHRLLIDAHDDGVPGRVPVKATDPRDFCSKVGIRGMEPVADAMRAPAPRSQDASDGTAAYALAAALVQGVSDCLVGPHVAKDHAVVCRSLACQLDDLAPSLQRNARWPPAPRRVEERLDARASNPAGTPLSHSTIAAPDEQGDPRWTVSVGKPDDDPRPNNDIVLGVPPPRERLDARPLQARDADRLRVRARIHLASIHEPPISFP